MQFRTVPTIGPRYWAAICLASVAGANLGDVVTDSFGWGYATGLPALAALFAVIALADRLSAWRSELWYWLAILAVRAAATDLADFTQGRRGLALGHLWTPALFAALLGLLLLARGRTGPGALLGALDGKPKADGLYWVTMLTAGTLGTALADAMARMVEPKEASALVALAVGSAAVILVLGWRARLFGPGATAGYWAAIVAIRTWGTTTGDILAHVLTLPVSALLSLSALAGVIVAWRRPDSRTAPAAA